MEYGVTWLPLSVCLLLLWLDPPPPPDYGRPTALPRPQPHWAPPSPAPDVPFDHGSWHRPSEWCVESKKAVDRHGGDLVEHSVQVDGRLMVANSILLVASARMQADGFDGLALY